MRWDSPYVLATASTLAIHVLIVTAGDAMIITHPPRPLIAAPRVELVEIEPPLLVRPPSPPVSATPAAAPPAPVKPAPAPRVARAAASHVRVAEPPPPLKATEPPPPGGDPVVQMDDIAPAATGIGVALGHQTTGHSGRGGTGGGTHASEGSGPGDAPMPVSVAMLKTRAMPKSGYDYTNQDYPPEARALGIEGPIRVRLVVDARGKVTSRQLLNRLGHGLDELALTRAAQIEFEPAHDTNDRPVASQLTWTFTFTISK